MSDKFKIRDLRRKEKFSIDDDYINGYAKYLDPFATAVYLSLCRHADSEQTCFPSINLIAKQHGIGEKTVKRKVKLLQEHGLIKIERERYKNGTFKNNTYYLLDKTEWKRLRSIKIRQGSEKVNPGVRKDHTVGSQRPLKDTHIKDTQRKVIKHKKYSSIKDIKEEDILQISTKYHVSVGFVKLQLEKLRNYCKAKGRRYKNYKSALRNFVLGDMQRQIERKQNDRYRPVDARNI